MRARSLAVIRFSFSPLGLLFGVAGPEDTKNRAGRSPPPDSDPFSDAEFAESIGR
jgi:FHA domain